MNKITIVGAGRVGESTAQFLAARNLCREIVLLDISDGAARGAALDIQEVAPLFAYDTRLIGSTDHALMLDSELIIITAGLPRKPGQSRSDVMASNIPIIDGIVEGAMKYAPDAILLFVTNPVDVITYHAFHKTGWPRNRVFGQAGVLDSSRMASFIAMETGFSSMDINTMVLGGHGDTMVPMLRYCTVAGIPVEKFIEKERLEAIVERTRNGGAEILALRQNSSAYDAPAASVTEMVDAIVHNRNRILPTVCLLDGEYGHSDIAIGVPAMLGQNGVIDIIELDMNKEEQAMFDHSASLVRKDIDLLRSM
ncbi:MAG TPA: malate dehydrogenase [Gammaproteobacteria bacterium]|nr:malate dehydrogenase [Gammaproteobacteria bacterium]